MKKFMSSLFVAGAMLTGVFASAKEKNVNVLPVKQEVVNNTIEKENDPTYCEGTIYYAHFTDDDGNSYEIIGV